MIQPVHLSHPPPPISLLAPRLNPQSNTPPPHAAIFDTDGSGAIDEDEFAGRDGLADAVIASLAS
jgi:hypothetical protein